MERKKQERSGYLPTTPHTPGKPALPFPLENLKFQVCENG